jgi:hypothetical protein
VPDQSISNCALCNKPTGWDDPAHPDGYHKTCIQAELASASGDLQKRLETSFKRLIEDPTVIVGTYLLSLEAAKNTGADMACPLCARDTRIIGFPR